MLEPVPSALDRPGAVNYVYNGTCPVSGQALHLPRTERAESLVASLCASLPMLSEGKMIGVLIVDSGRGFHILKAFSGLLDGSPTRDGWVPPIGGEPPPSTPHTLRRLQALKEQLRALASRDERQQRDRMTQDWDDAQASLEARLAANRIRRGELRAQGVDAATLDDESRHDSRERRLFKQARAQALAGVSEKAAAVEAEILAIKRERRILSRKLQAEMHAEFERTLTRDQPWSLASLFPQGLPTGTGDCCAPKLLYHAAVNGWTPIEMAEIWWGPPSPNGERQPGVYYGACERRCQPLLGPLLSRQTAPIEILHADKNLIVVLKPPGLLTVPGREHWKQDSLLTRLQRTHPNALAVHRLDLETSGVVVFALDASTQAHLQQQFAERTVEKIYHAWLSRAPSQSSGFIDMSLGRDPENPGLYRPDPTGREARTEYRVLTTSEVELRPLTGRSHQLRVHMACALGCPIRGDRLYGEASTGDTRLYLHASSLRFLHPTEGRKHCSTTLPPWKQ